jgi:hypothetical protein
MSMVRSRRWFTKRSRRPAKTIRKLLRLLQLESRTVPANITVTNLNDSGLGSLRAAITQADADPLSRDIVFDGSLIGGTVTLASNLPAITNGATITGPGRVASSITISGGGQFQPFNIASGKFLTLSHLTLTSARSGRGGAIVDAGILSMTDVVISNSVATGLVGFHPGGAIAVNAGALASLDHCVLTGNAGLDGGGAIESEGTLDVSYSRLTANTAGPGGVGSVAGASAGGAILSSGGVNLTSCIVSGNRAVSGGGIALFQPGTASGCFQCAIVSNIASNEGGGIDVAFTARLDLDETTIAFNQAGTGGIGGGGVALQGGTLQFTRDTIVRNSSKSNNAAGAGGIARAGGGTLSSLASIISENTSPAGTAGTDIAQGSLDSTSQDNFIGGTPALGDLRDNGGFVPSMMPLPGSPVIDSSAKSISFGSDGRGFPDRVDGNGDGVKRIDLGAVEFNPGVEQPIAVGTDAGVPARVRVYDYSGALRMDFLPYGGFAGGVRVATGDVNGDGITDIITAAGPGGGPHVQVFSGLDGTRLASFFAYDASFTGGVYVAAGDVNRDGKADIITGAGSGGGPHVKVFSGANTTVLLRSFMAYSTNFTGGVRVAATDFNVDLYADIITSPGPGGGPHVRVFSGADTSIELASFFAYSPTFTGGVYVAAGDERFAFGKIVTAPGPGMAPEIHVYGNGLVVPLQATFLAYAASFAGGVTVAATDIDGDGIPDIITGAGPSGGPHVRAFSGADQTPIKEFFAFDPTVLTGVFVG